MNFFTKMLSFLTIIFYMPMVILAKAQLFFSKTLLNYSVKKYGHISGMSGKFGLQLKNKANIIAHEVFMESAAFITQEREDVIMKAIDANKAYPYIPKEDRKSTVKPEDKTTFLCKYVNPYLDAKLGDELFSIQGVGNQRKERLLTGTQRLEILKECVTGWENFVGPDGKPVTFDPKNIEAMISMIPPPVRSELADFIRGESDLEEGETNG